LSSVLAFNANILKRKCDKNMPKLYKYQFVIKNRGKISFSYIEISILE